MHQRRQQRLPSVYSVRAQVAKVIKVAGEALAFNFPDGVNPADVSLVRAVSDAFRVKRVAI